MHYMQGGPKTRPFLTVYDSPIWKHRKAFSISKCSALYQE